jgi:hypothetical protein
MRTTVELPDDLFVAIKKRAIELHQPLKALIESALRKELGQFLGDQPPVTQKPIQWVTSSADSLDFDVSSREAMHKWIESQS